LRSSTRRFVHTAFEAAGCADGYFFPECVGQRFDRMLTVHLEAVQVEIAVEFDERLTAVRS
jgi:hypothetical protein